MFKQVYIRYLCIVLTGVVLIVTAGCRPHGILSSDKMEDVLFDLHFADGVISVTGWRNNKDSIRNLCYGNVLEKHRISQAQFDTSLMWYTSHPLLFDKIYPRVVARMDRELREIDSLMRLSDKHISQQQVIVTPKHKKEIEDKINRNIYGLKPIILRLDD